MTQHSFSYTCFLCVYMHRGGKYLFELDHDIFGQLHVLEHPLQFTGKCCSAFWRKSETQISQHAFSRAITHTPTTARHTFDQQSVKCFNHLKQ